MTDLDLGKYKNRRYKITLDGWVWCLHCHRFMQVKDLRVERSEGLEIPFCHFKNCDGGMFGADLWLQCDEDDPRVKGPKFPPIEELKLGIVGDL